MIQTVNTNTNPQPTFGVQASTVPIYTPAARIAPVLKPRQIAGLVPLICSDQDPRLPAFSKCDCREWTNDECYINPVFADLTDSDPIKNDNSYFLLEFPFFYNFQWTTGANSAFSLDKWDGTTWNGVASITDNTLGDYFDFNNLCIPNWKGVNLDWSKILVLHGEGLYRFSVSYSIFGQSGILVSEPYCLREWSCKETDVTVRWQTTIEGGRLGSIIEDCHVFQFCCVINPEPGFQFVTNVLWRDEIRVYAFFGRETTEYERVNVEYQNGEVMPVRSEAIQKFEYESALQPKWVHDRIKAYAFQADELFVTDYNWANSDYDIKKKQVICDGAYEPEYNINTRFSNVRVQLKEYCQNVIRDTCCDIPSRTAGT